MKISKLNIEGFGHFNQTSFGPFDAPIVVLKGPNEAGKSTLLNFIRSTLFGFPSRNRDQHYPPQTGGKHGGRIVIADDAGTEYIIERYVGTHGGPVTITGIDGEPYSSVKLNQLLGSATRDVFENVFAFSLDELQTSDLLKDENVNSQIYSAGMGSSNLPDLIKKMGSDMEKLYRPGGSKPIVNSIAAELDVVEIKIREITRNSARYSALKDSAENADEKISESAQRKQDLLKRGISLGSMKDGWESWVHLLDIEQQLEQLPQHTGLPANPIEELEKEEAALAAAKVDFNAAEELLQATRLDADAIQPDELVLEDEIPIADINQRKAAIEKSVSDLPERKEDVASQKPIVDKRLSSLGAGWSIERLENTDIGSFPINIEINGHKSSISNQKQKLLVLENSITILKNALKQEESTLSQAKDEFSGMSQPEFSQSELNVKKKVGSNATALRSEYRNASDTYEKMQSLSESKGQPENSLNTFLMPTALMVASLATTLVGIITTQPASFTYGVGGLILALAGFSYLHNRRASGRSFHAGDMESELDRTRKELEKIEIRLSESLAELGLDIQTIDDLDSLTENLGEIQVQITEWTTKQDKVLEAEKTVKKQNALVQDAENSYGAAIKELDELLSCWKQWLTDMELPPSLEPDAMDKYLGQIETGRKEVEDFKYKDGRMSAVEVAIDQYSVLATSLADRHAEDFDSAYVNSLITAMDRLLARLDDAKGKKIQKTQRLLDVAKSRGSLKKRKDELETAREYLKLMLKRASARDADEFRKKSQDQETGEGLSTKKQELVHALQVLSGPEKEFEAFRSTLTETNISEIESKLIEVKEKLEKEEGLYTGLIEDRAEANLQIEQMIDEDELSNLQVTRSQLQEQLSVSAMTWARFKLADQMLRRGRDKFQQERQPGVVRHAQEFFANVTDGRYPTLYAPIGEQTIAVMEKSGSQKQPDQLSRGTREQLYLSLRFGLIKEYGEHSEALPVIVDEVLVNFDPERARRACAAFAELSKTNQILVFTCHPEMVESFLETASDTQVIDIG